MAEEKKSKVASSLKKLRRWIRISSLPCRINFSRIFFLLFYPITLILDPLEYFRVEQVFLKDARPESRYTHIHTIKFITFLFNVYLCVWRILKHGFCFWLLVLEPLLMEIRIIHCPLDPFSPPLGLIFKKFTFPLRSCSELLRRNQISVLTITGKY